MKRLMCIILLIAISVSPCLAEEIPTFDLNTEEFFDAFMQAANGDALLSIDYDRVTFSQENTKWDWYPTLHTKAQAYLNEGKIQKIVFTGGGKFDNNIEALMIFAYGAMCFDELADEFDTGLAYVLRAINTGVYTSRKDKVTYLIDYDFYKGYSFTIMPTKLYSETGDGT